MVRNSFSRFGGIICHLGIIGGGDLGVQGGW